MNLATAIVVARANSVRLPGKALLPFAGTTLIGHKVRTLLRCKRIGRVVVGSDSDEILNEAERHGASVVKRDVYHCDERRCSANEMIHDMVSRVPGDPDETFVWAHPTNPLVRPETYDRAIAAFLSPYTARGGLDSVMSVRRENSHAWYDGRPLNHDGSQPPHRVAADLQPVFLQDGAIFIQSRAGWLRTKAFYGNPYGVVIEGREGLDIDTRDDYEAALALCESLSSVVAHPLSDTPAPLTLTSLSA